MSILQLQKEKAIAKAIVEVTRLHSFILAEVKNIRALAEEIRGEYKRVRSLPKGEKGDRGPAGPAGVGLKGKDGKTPVKGADYFTESEKAEIIRETLKYIKIPTVKDGKDAVIDEEKLAKDVLDLIIEKKLLPLDKLNALESTVSSYRHQMAMKQAGQHGGGTTVSAGSNITLVPQADGTVQINASGGGSGTNVATQYALTAVQAGADVTIDLSQLTNFATYVDLIALYRNNQVQTEGASYNFTVTGSIITVFNADASEIFNVTYAYS